MSINRVVLLGRCTTSPELKTTPNGVNVTSFSIAVDRPYVKQGEEKQTDFINIVAWRNTADFISKYFTKGSMIAIDGYLQTRTYKAKDGSNRYITEVVADKVSFTGEKTNTYQNNENSINQQDDYIPLDEDLPF